MMMIIMPLRPVESATAEATAPMPPLVVEAGRDGATPLDPDEAEGLIPELETQKQLNEWEHANILKAYPWAFGRAGLRVFDMEFALELHRRMFDETWKWAGTLRRSDKNRGVHWPTILDRLRDVLDNAAYWRAHKTFPLDEAAVRFHHQLVWVHPFPNGNGRFSRLMAEILIANENAAPFTWGSADPTIQARARDLYLAALHDADGGKFASLLSFARS